MKIGWKTPAGARSFRHWGLEKKLILVYGLMMIVSAWIVTWIGFRQYHHNLTERVGEFGLNLADQVSRNLDNYLAEIDGLSMTFYLDGVDGLRGKKDPLDLYMERIAVDEALRNIMFFMPFRHIQGIYWISDGEVQYSQYGVGKWVDHSDFVAEGGYDRVLTADGSGVILPPYRPDPAETGERFIFSYARSIVNVANRASYGVLLIDLSTDHLLELLEETKAKTSSTLFIVDDAGTIVFHPDARLIGTAFSPALPGAYGTFETDWNEGRTMVQYVRSDRSGWTVVNTVPTRQLSDELAMLRNLSIAFTAVAALLSIFLSSLFTVTVIKPLKGMERLMRRVEMGDYSVRFPQQTQDEIGRLGRSFNHMVEKINELVNRVLTMKIYRQQAEVKVLRSQINPHFLYNTLESINMKAELNEDYEVADMVSLLGKLFRLSLQENAEYIPLSREAEYTEVYMRLQRIRFPKLRYTAAFDEEVLRAYTLPWIIQPLVENALVHGIAPARGQGAIEISAERRGDDLAIRIADDGCGLDEARLAEVNGRLRDAERNDDDRHDGHIGLTNVHKRIYRAYGEGYGLTIERRPGGGTVATIRMRFTREGGDVECLS